MHITLMNITFESRGSDSGNRILVTRPLVGERWLDLLTSAGFHIDICTIERTLSPAELIEAIGTSCVGAIGQLSESWNADVLRALHAGGGRVVCNYAVGYNNIDVTDATRLGIAVGNTPGVLTEATAELAAALTYAAIRHVVPADGYTREGHFVGWAPSLFLGDLLHRKTLGVLGPGRIGTAFIRCLAFGNRMDIIYVSRSPKGDLEREVASFNRYLMEMGERPISITRAGTLRELLEPSDVVALLSSFDPSMRHLIGESELKAMKPNAVLVNASRGPVVDESALVRHLQTHPGFRAGLDVYEDEPRLAEGLRSCSNAVLMPHIGSATHWSREAMSVLAARNLIGVLQGWPRWNGSTYLPLLADDAPQATPSIVNIPQ